MTATGGGVWRETVAVPSYRVISALNSRPERRVTKLQPATHAELPIWNILHYYFLESVLFIFSFFSCVYMQHILERVTDASSAAAREGTVKAGVVGEGGGAATRGERRKRERE